MNTFQLIQVGMAVVFAVSAMVVGRQSSGYAKQAEASAQIAEAAARRAEAALKQSVALRQAIRNSKEQA